MLTLIHIKLQNVVTNYRLIALSGSICQEVILYCQKIESTPIPLCVVSYVDVDKKAKGIYETIYRICTTNKKVEKDTFCIEIYEINNKRKSVFAPLIKLSHISLF